jgi:hypothetical protein
MLTVEYPMVIIGSVPHSVILNYLILNTQCFMCFIRLSQKKQYDYPKRIYRLVSIDDTEFCLYEIGNKFCIFYINYIFRRFSKSKLLFGPTRHDF